MIRIKVNELIIQEKSSKHAVTLIPGDGISPEVAGTTCGLIEAAGVKSPRGKPKRERRFLRSY